MPPQALPFWYRVARWIWHGPIGRGVQRCPRIGTMSNSLKRSELVRERLRFVVCDLRRSEDIARYTLAANGKPVHLRHPNDVWAFDELLVKGEYAVPRQVEPTLTSIGRPVRILDLGGHVGLFGAWAAANWDVASIVSFEPDPDLAAVLRAQSRAHTGILWHIVPAAAWNADGQLAFASGHLGGHVDPEDGEDGAISVATRDVLPALMQADVVKIDIEGSEWILLEDPRFAAVGARIIVLEAHPRYCPDPADPALYATRALERAGLRVVEVRHKPFGHVALLWAIRPTPDGPTPPRAAGRERRRSEAAPAA